VGLLLCLPALSGGVAGEPQATRPPLFLESAAATGLTFTHVNGATGAFYLPEQMGPGVALFDADNDNDLDVFLVQGGTLGAAGPGGARPASRLFRNDLDVDAGGRRTLRFVDVTTRAGVGLVAQGMGAAVGDYNNDGWIDLFVTTYGRNVLYRNNGNGTFTDMTKAAGLIDDRWSTSATFVDYDRDGHLDLFVANYVDFTVAGNRTCATAGTPDYCNPGVYKPVLSRLYRNLGTGRFADVTTAAGISKAFGSGLGVVAGDYNEDGWLDLYVANDANPNQLWINRRNGTFVDEGFPSGAAVNAAGAPEASMGLASGDFDADGREDLFVTNLAGETFVLYRNGGQGLFEDIRTRAGLAAPTAMHTGFGTDWFDYDNDGWLDLFMANGGVSIVAAQRGQARPYRMPNQLFRNNGSGRFVETTAAAGPALTHGDIGRGAAFGDIDNDGDVDVVVANNGAPVRLLLNQAGRINHWLQVRLAQAPRNRIGLGARVGLERSGRPTLWRRVKTDGSYLSASDSRVHFGLGPSPAIGAVVVEWPDGARERWATGVAANRAVTLTRGTGAAMPAR
jgi:hypothetical protein